MPARNTFRNSVAVEASADQREGQGKERPLRPLWWPSPIAREALAEEREARAVEREARAVEREALRSARQFHRFGDRLFVEITDSVDVSVSDIEGEAAGDVVSLLSEIFERLERIEDLLATLGFTDEETEEEGEAEDDGAPGDDETSPKDDPSGDGPHNRRPRGGRGPGQA